MGAGSPREKSAWAVLTPAWGSPLRQAFCPLPLPHPRRHSWFSRDLVPGLPQDGVGRAFSHSGGHPLGCVWDRHGMSGRPGLREAHGLLRFTRRGGTEPGPDRTAQGVSIFEFLSFITSPSLPTPPSPMLSPPAVLFPAGTQRHHGTPRTSWTKGRKGGCLVLGGSCFLISGVGRGKPLGHCGWASVGSRQAHPCSRLGQLGGQCHPSCGRQAGAIRPTFSTGILGAWHQNKHGRSSCLPGASS